MAAAMSLLLPMTVRPHPFPDELRAGPLDVGAATAGHPPFADVRSTQRARIKAALLERRYKHILEARLTHIPIPLPFPRTAILARLKENDRNSPNWAEQLKFLELDTDLQLLARELSLPPRQAGREERRLRRLSYVWDYLAVHTERIRGIARQREGRLSYNVSLFFKSDLPASYFTDIGHSTYWETAALIIAQNANAQRLIQRLAKKPAEEMDKETFLQTSASLQEVDRAFRDYAKRFARTASLTDKVLEWRDALEYYVDLFSAPDLSTFRVPRSISTASLDLAVLDPLSKGLRAATVELRRAVSGDYPGGVSEFQWLPRDDPYAAGLIRLELEPTQAG